MDAQTSHPDEAALWTAWREHGDRAAREDLVAVHQDFARIIAAKLYGRRYTNEVEFDEYLQFARVGLLESVDRYDPSLGASFRTYAAHRMEGAVLSGLECLSECSRQVGLRRRLEQDRLRSLSASEDDGEPATPVPDAFERLVSVAVGLAVGFMLDDVAAFQASESTAIDTAYHDLAERETRQRLHALIGQLPAREARIVRHHYLQHLPFEEIAREMELTPGRISQLHKRALERLRTLLQGEKLDRLL